MVESHEYGVFLVFHMSCKDYIEVWKAMIISNHPKQEEETEWVRLFLPIHIPWFNAITCNFVFSPVSMASSAGQRALRTIKPASKALMANCLISLQAGKRMTVGFRAATGPIGLGPGQIGGFALAAWCEAMPSVAKVHGNVAFCVYRTVTCIFFPFKSTLLLYLQWVMKK